MKFLPKTFTWVNSPTRIDWKCSGDLIAITPPSEGHQVFWWDPKRAFFIQRHHDQFIAPTALDNCPSPSCSYVRGITKCLVLDLSHRSLSHTFCAEIWAGARWRISVWQTAWNCSAVCRLCARVTGKLPHSWERELSIINHIGFLCSPLM